MPRLLFLNRSYYPDAEATGQLLTELCEHLAQHENFDVTVIPGQPYQNPLGLPFRRCGTEEHGGVTIQRVWNTRLPKRWLPAKALNLISYLVLATWRTLTQKQRPDVVVVETDPPLLCLLGAVARWRYGCQLVVYLQDIYPDVAVAVGKLRDGALSRWLRKQFIRAYHSAERVIVLSRDMRDLLNEWGIPAEKVITIPNWIDCSRVVLRKEGNLFRQRHQLNNKFVVMYAGNLGLCQGLENVIEAAQRLGHRSDIVFFFIGDGALRKKLEVTVAETKVKNVTFLGYHPAPELPDCLGAANLHLVPLDARVSRFLMPSKLYGVLASGTPALVVAPRESELAEIVTTQEVGYVVEPGNPQALADQIEALADHPGDLPNLGQRARQLALARYDRGICLAQFATLMHALLGDHEADDQGSTPLPAGGLVADGKDIAAQIA